MFTDLILHGVGFEVNELSLDGDLKPPKRTLVGMEIMRRRLPIVVAIGQLHIIAYTALP